MNKRKSINQKIYDLQKQLKDLETMEQQKAGSYILGLYEKGEIKDESIRIALAKIVGDMESYSTGGKHEHATGQTEINRN